MLVDSAVADTKDWVDKGEVPREGGREGEREGGREGGRGK